MGVSEAKLVQTDGGLEPEGSGWFVLNAKQARWLDGHFGAYTRFEGDERFSDIGINIGVLAPGQPACYYHGEDAQEAFLVSGECLLLIEGEERRLKAWDFVHSPPWAEHVFVGAGDGPCAVLAVGAGRTGASSTPHRSWPSATKPELRPRRPISKRRTRPSARTSPSATATAGSRTDPQRA